MNFLKQVIDILSKYEQKTDVFNETELENTAFHRLYTGVKASEYSSDVDAALDIYRADPTDSRYRNLKSRLKRKLANNLFFLRIEEPEHSESLAAKYEVERQLFTMKILAAFGATRAAFEVANQILPVAQRFHLTNAIIESLILLRDHTAYSGRVREHKSYIELLNQYLLIQTSEIRAGEVNEWFSMTFVNTKSVSLDVLEKTHQAVEEVSVLWETYKTFPLFLLNLRMKSHLFQLTGDYNSVLHVCEEAELYYQNQSHLITNARMVEIAMYKNLCYLYLRRYQEGIQNAEKHSCWLQKGSSNWFNYMEEYFLLFLHSDHIHKAREVYDVITQHINFDTGIPQRKETWEIFGLYLSFVEGKGNPDMDKFMKDMEVFRYDKSGVYVAVLALSILILLRNGDYPTILNRNEYLKKYLTRYLKGDDHVRSAAFFRLLRLMIRKEFNLPQILKAGVKDIAVLHDQSLRLDDYEVMPYEKMWDIVVEVLEEKARTSHDIPL